MKLSNMFFKTYREAPADAEIKSHKLLVQAGYIKKQGMGSYIYLPLGLKVIDNINKIIREELNKTGCMEIAAPMLLSEDVYENRLSSFGGEMFRLRDRNNKGFCLGPTHEEVFTNIVKDTTTSYKQLPIMLYQIQTKFRDDIRPRFGLQRAREFLMKDAYTFDKDLAGLDVSFEKINQAYHNIFNRLGLDFVTVEADNGSMGGSMSCEFMVKNDVGEDGILVCDCGYAGNVEKVECQPQCVPTTMDLQRIELIHTPDVKTVEQLCQFLNKNQHQFAKTVAYKYDKGIAIVVVRGDREVEETKVKNALFATTLELASQDDIIGIGSVAGYIGATDQLKNCVVLADNEVKFMNNFIIGANKLDYHYTNANISDLKVDKYLDVRKAVNGDPCPKCGKPLQMVRGIEVGHIFKLNDKYTKLLDCKYLDECGKTQVMQMGCYGIGVTRTLSSIVEQYADQLGMIWPEVIAPYKVIVVCANIKDENQFNISQDIYNKLLSKNVEVLFDDRKESLGVKLKDAELIGIPNIIIVGKNIADNNVEVVDRKTLEKQLVSIDRVVDQF